MAGVKGGKPLPCPGFIDPGLGLLYFLASMINYGSFNKTFLGAVFTTLALGALSLFHPIFSGSN